VKRFECIVTSAEAELRGRIVGDFDKTGRLIWLGLCPEQAVQTPVACLKWVEYLPTFDILMRSDSLSFSAIKLNSPIRVPILFLAADRSCPSLGGDGALCRRPTIGRAITTLS
jgi:hypothetical protein